MYKDFISQCPHKSRRAGVVLADDGCLTRAAGAAARR
jgi:hypothetical protein